MVKYIFTQDELFAWFSNKEINPRTDRKIKINGPTYKILEQQYITLIEEINKNIHLVNHLDIIYHQLQYLDLRDILNMRLVSKQYNYIINSNNMWKILLQRDYKINKKLNCKNIYITTFKNVIIPKNLGDNLNYLDIKPYNLNLMLKKKFNYIFDKKAMILLSYLYSHKKDTYEREHIKAVINSANNLTPGSINTTIINTINISTLNQYIPNFQSIVSTINTQIMNGNINMVDISNSLTNALNNTNPNNNFNFIKDLIGSPQLDYVNKKFTKYITKILNSSNAIIITGEELLKLLEKHLTSKEDLQFFSLVKRLKQNKKKTFYLGRKKK